MTLLTKEVEVKWGARNKRHYTSLGYEFTKMGDSFKIPVEHLSSGSGIKVEVQCDYCNKVYSPRYVAFLKGRRRAGELKKDACTNCGQIKSNEIKLLNGAITIADIPELLEEWNDDADPSRVMTGSGIKYRWKCSKCSGEWEARPNDRTHGHGCPHCVNYFRYTEPLNASHPELVDEWSDRNELRPDEVTAGSDKRIIWECKTCSHEWKARPKHRTHGKGCPICNESKGERLVSELLRSLNVDFAREYEFIEGKLKGVAGRYLRYDFALFLHGELFALIEVDGEFHRRNVYGDDEGERIFTTQQEHDRRKDLFAEYYDIPLFRIRYDSGAFSERDLNELKEFVNGWKSFEKTIHSKTI